QHRAQDRGVGDVRLLAALEVLQLDAEVAAVVVARLEQRAEGGVAVERRHAAPHHPRAAIDERAEAAVADDAEVEAGRVHPRAPCRSHSSTAPVSARPWVAALGSRGPTSTLAPPRSLTTAKPCSSVRSSPTNTGVRPRNGASSIRAAIASPLSAPPGRSSATWLPY